MFKLLYIYDFSFKFVKMKCRKMNSYIYNVSYGIFMDGYNVYWG